MHEPLFLLALWSPILFDVPRSPSTALPSLLSALLRSYVALDNPYVEAFFLCVGDRRSSLLASPVDGGWMVGGWWVGGLIE